MPGTIRIRQNSNRHFMAVPDVPLVVVLDDALDVVLVVVVVKVPVAVFVDPPGKIHYFYLFKENRLNVQTP